MLLLLSVMLVVCYNLFYHIKNSKNWYYNDMITKHTPSVQLSIKPTDIKTSRLNEVLSLTEFCAYSLVC